MSNSNLSERNEQTSKGCASTPAARERAIRSFQLNGWLLLVTVTFLVALYVGKHHPEWSPGWQITLALSPILPGLLYLRKGLQLLRGLDELQRRIQLEAWLFAALGTVVVSTIVNVFNAHGLVEQWAPHGLEVGATYMTMFILWGIGNMIANLRYYR
jgi:hypothetical protein